MYVRPVVVRSTETARISHRGSTIVLPMFRQVLHRVEVSLISTEVVLDSIDLAPVLQRGCNDGPLVLYLFWRGFILLRFFVNKVHIWMYMAVSAGCGFVHI